MIVALIVAAVLAFLLFSPAHIVFRYISNEADVYIRLWYVIKIRFLKDKKKQEHPTEKTKNKTKAPPKPKEKLTFSERMDQIAAVFRLAVNTLKLFCKYFSMYRCKVRIFVTGDDPADVATEFGLVNAAAYGIISFLDEKIKIKKKEIEIGCEYVDESSTFEVDFRFRVVLLKFLIVLICTNIRDIMTVLDPKSQEIKQEVK